MSYPKDVHEYTLSIDDGSMIIVLSHSIPQNTGPGVVEAETNAYFKQNIRKNIFYKDM